MASTSTYSHHTSQSAETCKFGQDNNYHLENQLKTLRLHGSSTKRQKFPLSTHSPWHPNNIEDQQKETMSKQEIEDLRSSVLRTNRPVNPWFDAQKKMSPDSTPSTSSSPTFTPPHAKASQVPCKNAKVTSPPNVSNSTFQARQVKVESPNKNGRLTGRINWHKSVNASTRRELDNIVAEPYLLPKHQISNGFLPPKPPRKEDYTVDFTQMLASDIKLLEQLEAEHLERATKVVPKSTASNSPIHQIIETQNRSQKMTKNVEFQVNDVTATQKTIRKPPNAVSSYPDETLSFESNTKVTEEKQPKMPVCASCRGVIRDVILQALGHCFHPTCFRCTACRVCLDGVPFAVNSANEVFCMKDYEKATIFPICAACGGTISASNDLGQIVRIVAQGNEYHIDCYNCEGCGLQLSNEAHSKCYPLKTHSSNHLLCKTCHLQWRRLSESLQTPITDL